MLCNRNLTMGLTMNPEKTMCHTNGPDGKQRLTDGPKLPSYGGLIFINTRKFTSTPALSAASSSAARTSGEPQSAAWCRQIEKSSVLSSSNCNSTPAASAASTSVFVVSGEPHNAACKYS